MKTKLDRGKGSKDMKISTTLGELKSLWKIWNIRGAVLTSLSFQILLIVIAPFRKRTGNLILIMFIWSAYLLADWVATYAIGLIANAPLDDCKMQKVLQKMNSTTTTTPTQLSPAECAIKVAMKIDLNAFWASFLLGHLGGPHTITAFSLEDNELWIRHLLQLVVHFSGIAYIFKKSLPSELWIPTTLVYFAGLFKYIERTRALYCASVGTLKTSTLPPPTAGSNYARLMQAYRSKLDASIPVNIILAETPEVKPPAVQEGLLVDLTYGYRDEYKDIQVVQEGYRYFDRFKGLLVDLTYGYRDWQKTREFFFKRTAKEAFRIMEVELNFLYDLLYTKMAVVHRTSGFVFRFVCLGFIVVALEQFVFYHKRHKHGIHDIEFDMYVTYTLLIGAISLDLFAIFKITFSDWTIARASEKISRKLLACWFAIRINLSLDKNYRWSKSVSQHSLINYCFEERFKWVFNEAFNRVGKEFLDEIRYKTTEDVTDNLKEFIFKELRDKALQAGNAKAAKEICSRRGEKVLLQAPRFYTSLAESVEVEYDESVLRWHVATELCYHKTIDTENEDANRQLCKILSEYMLYLLVMRPTMMSPVAGIVQIRFLDTCEEAKNFFQTKHESTRNFSELIKNSKFFQTKQELRRKFSELLNRIIRKSDGVTRQSTKLFKACNELLSVDTVVPPSKVKGGTSKSVLFEGCIMAKDLLNMEKTERWKIMSKVWVELLSYAASHCRAHAHAQQLSKGGEFITFVWLLMIHFGMGEPFRVDPDSRYKLVVGK